MDLTPPRLISLFSDTASLCVSALRGWNTNSQPTSDSKPKATGRGHPPTAHRHRDFPAVCARVLSLHACLSACMCLCCCSQVCVCVCVQASVCLGVHFTLISVYLFAYTCLCRYVLVLTCVSVYTHFQSSDHLLQSTATWIYADLWTHTRSLKLHTCILIIWAHTYLVTNQRRILFFFHQRRMKTWNTAPSKTGIVYFSLYLKFHWYLLLLQGL